MKETLKKTRAYSCLDCGKCTAICPISRVNQGYSPRRLLTKALTGSNENLLSDKTIWTCLTCMQCQEKCPSDIDYIQFTRLIRFDAKGDGQEAACSHGGALQSLMKIMTAPELKQNRLGWITPDLKTSEKSEYIYFVGCTPYFDVFFADIKANSLESARSTLKILNFLGIEPQVLPNERCCGHDLLWMGDLENFKRLAEHNLKLIKESGAKKIITSCPEGLTTLKVDYPEMFGTQDYEVLHISELIAESLSDNQSKLKKLGKKVTYQDPCRLGRFCGIFDAPRQVIEACGAELVEMRKNRRNAICCGTSSWANCDAYSRMIQANRLKEAKDTGAEVLITACPKCQIHFSCTQNAEGYSEEDKIEILDLTTFFAQALK
ncbi:MAG: (Fe-S)-binding protein [Candidatus Zixiibacteriota bacterium]